MQLQFECDYRWDDFEGDGAVERFCPHCEKTIHNVSAMTRAQAREFFIQRRGQGEVCVTFARRGSSFWFADDLQRLESQRDGIRQLVRAAAVVVPMLILGCDEAPSATAEPAHVEPVVRFGEPAAAARTDISPALQRYHRNEHPERYAVPSEPSLAQARDKAKNRIERLFDDLFGESMQQKYDDANANVVAGGMEF